MGKAQAAEFVIVCVTQAVTDQMVLIVLLVFQSLYKKVGTIHSSTNVFTVVGVVVRNHLGERGDQ